jgi:hypothetical protein
MGLLCFFFLLPNIPEDLSLQYYMFQERFLPLGLHLSQIFGWMKSVVTLEGRADLIHSLVINND